MQRTWNTAAATMRSFAMQPVAIILLIAIAIIPVLTLGTSSAINTTCAAAIPTQARRDYCVGVLSADPAALAATDARGVAAAAVNITADKAASTLRVITELIDELSLCRGYYSTMVDSLAGVLNDTRTGRVDNVTLAKAQEAKDQPLYSCDIMLFEGSAHKNPISQENGENDLFADLVLDITFSLMTKRT